MTEAKITDLISLTADIVSAHVSHNTVAPADVAELIHSVHLALSGATAPAVPDSEPLKPAVSVRSSVQPDYLVCLEDGAKVTMLKRYLRTRFGLTPDEYRAKWGLPKTYPMSAPNYQERRREIATKIGLGRKKPVEADVVEPAVKAKPKLMLDMSGEKPKRGRPPKASMSTSEALEKARAHVTKPEPQQESRAAVSETPTET